MRRKIIILGFVCVIIVGFFVVPSFAGAVQSDAPQLASLLDTLSAIVQKLKDIVASIARTWLTAQVMPAGPTAIGKGWRAI